MNAERNGWSKWILGIAAAIAVIGAAGSVSNQISVSGRLGGIEAGIAAIRERLEALELGITTPMAHSTKERFDSLERRIQSLESRLDRLAEQFHALQGIKRKPLRESGRVPLGSEQLLGQKPVEPEPGGG